jgi:outer membrane biosynthesis protein TonB
MHNTGTWDSDLACIFFLCLLAPICWYFLVAAIEAQAAINAYKATKRQAPKKSSATKPSKPMQISVSFNLPNLKGWGQQPQPKVSKPPKKVASQPKTKPKPKSKPKPKAKASPQKPLTSSIFQNEAVSALSGLGFKKSDASKIVKDVSSKKQYDSTESLIKACFMCI